MKKYRLIIILIISIVIFNIAVAVTSYWMTQNINRLNAYTASLAQQQAALDKMSKDIIDINFFSERLAHEDKQQGEQAFLQQTYNQVDDTKTYFQYLQDNINTFSYGGSIDVVGNEYSVEPPTGELVELDQHIQEIWQPLSVLIHNVINQFEQRELVDLGDNIRFAADYTRKYSEILGKYLSSLQAHYQKEVEQYSYRLRLLQIMAIVFTILFFAVLTFTGLRSLIRSDRNIEYARQETANIMKTVKEGLFLIDENLHIGQQYSAQLETILGQKSIAGRELQELLSKVVNKKDYETTCDFIEQLFNADVIEALIHELNPLDRIKSYIAKKDGSLEQRYLSFNFSRVYDDDGNIINVLVSVSDISRQIMLEERIEKERVQHDEQMELLSNMLNIPTVSLDGFIRNIQTACQRINAILRGSNLNKGNLVDQANKIFREVHGMKGEASALGLQHFVSIAENMENQISILRSKANVTGRDFLSLTIELDQTLMLLQKITDLRQKITQGMGQSVSHSAPPVVENPSHDVSQKPASTINHHAVEGHAVVGHDVPHDSTWQFSRLVAEVAKRQHKQVHFSCKGWSYTEVLGQHQQDKLREIMIQLLRNAVVHGIETGEERLAQGKQAVGRIHCEVKSSGDRLAIVVHDDGRGIDFAALQEKAIAEGKLDPALAPAQVQQMLIKYLFSSGVSTANTQNEDAGRGVGMDVVKSRLQELGANIALSSKEGMSTTFKIRIPLSGS